MLRKGILKAPKSTPKDMLHLELGLVAFREIIRRRRFGFLYYILHEKEDSMVFKFFESQRKNKTSKDWVTTVLEDMNKIKLNMDFDELRNMKKISVYEDNKEKNRI